ncbi:PTS transporter subunit EIIC [Alkalibacterium pelagium]|uniref:PTS system, maltose and glucose-specific IIC component n=1 Tax=Alkalibacterium pelagium TaxID=426702 RepID=A0A1H7PBV5_9LACT|nr:PTS transporter subunit EIIC [Alkalibacterium pelagium]GEN51608.1 PTS maltose transporter subunit IICB [Alkalibacterium pelagium]SEL33139.1 PTS system, maltose and glucose-specific IIC component [Alkalibacterium pelagium]
MAKDFWQRLGKSLMTPISLIAAAGIFLGIAAVLQNPSIVGETFINMTAVQSVIGIIRALAGGIFGNLPILFAVSISFGLARKEKTTAAFAGVIGFLLFHITIQYLLQANDITAATYSVEALMETGLTEVQATQTASQYESVLGIFTLRMNVFGGIIVGMLVSYLHNTFHTIDLPTAISFFGGKRFVPIVTTVSIPFLAILMYFVWPFFGAAIEGIGNIIAQAGLLGTFLFGFLERLLIPTGLHHILNQLVRFTPIGGVAEIDGNQVVGALNIFNTSLAQDSPDLGVMAEATRFLAQGKIPFMVFGLPAAAFAMVKVAYQEKKKDVKGLMSASGLASFTTGITEPIEFSFIFVSPILFIFHAFMAGLSFMLMDALGVVIGNVQGGVIDLFVFGILQGTATNWFWAVLVGLIYAPIYYFVFKTVIEKRRVLTPGRDVNDDEMDIETDSKVSEDKLGDAIVNALGGAGNIQSIDNCFTRLRLVLGDTSKVDEAGLKKTGAAGVVKIDETNYQVIYGPKVESIAPKVKGAANYHEE